MADSAGPDGQVDGHTAAGVPATGPVQVSTAAPMSMPVPMGLSMPLSMPMSIPTASPSSAGIGGGFPPQMSRQPASQAPVTAAGMAPLATQPTGQKRPFDKMNGPVIYKASYSDVAVFEMEVDGVAVMRRIPDSWLNATQILKLAGVEKGRRTKVLEREILPGEHEKVQGGYGKYQGTWVSFTRGRDLCRQYGVEQIVRPLLDYDPALHGDETPTKEQAMAAHRKRIYAGITARASAGPGSASRNGPLANRFASADSGPGSMPQPGLAAPAGQHAGSAVSPGIDAAGPDGLPHGTFFSNISPAAAGALAAMNKANSSRASSFTRWSSAHQSGPNASGGQISNPGSNHGSGPTTITDLELTLDEAVSSPELQAASERARKRMRTDAGGGPDGGGGGAGQISPDTSPPALPPSGSAPLPAAREPMPNPDSDLARERQSVLLDLFSAEPDPTVDPASAVPDPTSLVGLDRLTGPTDLDTPLDKSANTALHWAATLGRVGLVRLLLSRGADMFRGNIAGQTALMAAVAVSNCLDHGCFPGLVELLSPLIELQDGSGRTILHHIVVASGIRGRERSSRYYLEVLLEFLVRSLTPGSHPLAESGPPSSSTVSLSVGPGATSSTAPIDLMRFLRTIVNAQDKAGNTALHLAARVGNGGIVQQLLEVLADPFIPNQHGLRPVDFGLPGFDPGPAAATVGVSRGLVPEPTPTIGPSASGSTTTAPATTSSVRAAIASIEQVLIDSHTRLLALLSDKQAAVESANNSIQALSAEQRAVSLRLASIRRSRRDRAERTHRIANLKSTLADGHARLLVRQSGMTAPNVPTPVHPSSLLAVQSRVFNVMSQSPLITSNITVGLADKLCVGHSSPLIDPSQPTGEMTNQESNVRLELKMALSNAPTSALRAIAAAYTANERMLTATATELKRQHGAVEATFRRLVSLCTDLPEHDVDPLLDRLLVAVESDGVGEGEVSRVRDFLRRVMG